MVERRPHPTHWFAALRKAARLLAAARGRPVRVVVSGDSMLPRFRPGDRLVVLPVSRVHDGDVVAVADPRAEGRLLVKRVHRAEADRVDVRGDNPPASTDSRHFGLLPTAAVRGRAVYRYHPPERSGWLDE